MSRATLVLVRHSLRRIRGFVAGLAVILFAFQFLLIEVGAYLTRQSAFGQLSALLPDFVRSAAGPAALAFMSFSGIVGLGYFDPPILAALLSLTITIATEPAAEIEMRFVDLTLARPLARLDLVVRTLMVLLVSAIVVLAVMVTGTSLGLACCAPAGIDRPSFRVLVSLALSLAAVMACFGGIALALAAVARRRAVAAGVAGAAAFVAYLLDYLGRAWEPARSISVISPFHYFEPMTIVMGGSISGRNVAVLLAIALVGTTLGFVAFSRRDV